MLIHTLIKNALPTLQVAHAAVLAAQSKVLCDMFYTSGCKPSTPFDGKMVWRVPLPNATATQAITFINYIYYLPEELALTIDSVRGIIEILHRLDCTTALQKLDGYLTSEAGSKVGRPKHWVSRAQFGSAC